MKGVKEAEHKGEQALERTKDKGKVSQSASRAEGKVKHGTKRLSTAAQENPFGLALGGVAVGFLAGLIVPATQMEEQKLGPVGGELREQASKTGHEAPDRGKHVAEEAAHSAAETAKEQGRQQGQELADHAKQSGREVASRMPS